MTTIPEIINKAGGPAHVARSAGLTLQAVRRWREHGVPDRHWPTLMKLSGVSLPVMFAANQAIRAKGEAA